MTLVEGKLYKINGSIYDFWDNDCYIIRITSELIRIDKQFTYYDAELISPFGRYYIHFFPEDWRSISELSSLETELL